MPEEQPSAVVLRGQAVDVPLRNVTGDGLDVVGLIMDCNVLADLEESYSAGVVIVDRDDDGEVLRDETGMERKVTRYGIEAWQGIMVDRPFSALRRVIALCLGVNEREAGARMLLEKLPDYFLAIGAAFAIANGMDPTEALASAQERFEKQQAAVLKQLGGHDDDEKPTETKNSDTPGPTGPPHGATPGDLSTSSGD